MEEIIIGTPESMEIPPEPPQKTAEEIGLVRKPNRPDHRRPSGFDMKQPEKKEESKDERKEIEKVTPQEAKSMAVRPKLDRTSPKQGGKITKRAKGLARPL